MLHALSRFRSLPHSISSSAFHYFAFYKVLGYKTSFRNMKRKYKLHVYFPVCVGFKVVWKVPKSINKFLAILFTKKFKTFSFDLEIKFSY